MAQSSEGSWLLVEELLARGDSRFVDEVRKVSDAGKLGALAAPWYADRQPATRQLLFEYLSRPLNAYRHEALVKRLFKLAEKAGDDEVMARFLVLFDRSIRRSRRKKYHFENRSMPSAKAAEALRAQWEEAGYETVNVSNWNNQHSVWGRWFEEQIVTPRWTAMPRGKQVKSARNPRTGERITYEKDPPRPGDAERLRLFSVHTRHYLRRRTWRYFRNLAKTRPERYLPAVVQALKLYEDSDVRDALALLDCWGLVHILFHSCPALIAKANGWTVAEGHTLAELAPAPYQESLWQQMPAALIDLLRHARCRPVRQWTVRMVRRDMSILKHLPVEELLDLLGNEETEIVDLAAEALRGAAGLDALPLERWLKLLETPNAQALEILCELLASKVPAEKVSLAEAVQVACRRPLPVARLGLRWLQGKQAESEADCVALFQLAEAEAAPVRPELVSWARGILAGSPHFQPGWVLELLDSRHVDVRAIGWAWLQGEARVRDNADIWRRLLESPYDDVRLSLVTELEKHTALRRDGIDESALDPELLRYLWASVLLNIHRGNRKKPLAVHQLVRRVARRPAEAPVILPILSVALRSIRGPEWRAGLAGVVGLVARNPELEPAVQAAFPELKLA